MKWLKFRLETELRSVNRNKCADSIADLVAKIYCDIFRPVTDTKIPAILAISPYGKNGHGT